MGGVVIKTFILYLKYILYLKKGFWVGESTDTAYLHTQNLACFYGRDKEQLYPFDISSVNILASIPGFLVNIRTSSNLALVPHTMHYLINLNMSKTPKKERAKYHSQVQA